jgi:hypothetical protein
MAKSVTNPKPRRTSKVKAPYVTPRLIEYGNVAKLTSSNGTLLPLDGLSQRMPGVCL